MTQKQSALHEILAVEADIAGVATRIIPEATKTFKEKSAHFNGSHRTLKLFSNEAGEEQTTAAEKAEEQVIVMVSTVSDKLKYVLDQVTRYYDVVLQKEATNQEAVADLIVDGVTLATDLPVGFLLGMETKLKTLRAVYEEIPTLAPGIAWVADEISGKGIRKMELPETRAKTAKQFRHQVLVQPTDKHPAQIEKWEDTINVGVYTKQVTTSAYTVTEKSELLGRVDSLIQAFKQARQRANSTPIVQKNIGKTLVDFIHPAGL